MNQRYSISLAPLLAPLSPALIAIALVIGLADAHAGAEEVPPPSTPKEDAKKGNWAEAYVGFRAQLERGDMTGEAAANSLQGAAECLRRLNRIAEFDAMVEMAIKKYPGNWRVLAEAANRYNEVEHHGRMVAGEFERGRGRGQAEILNSMARDRVRALQLYEQAYRQAEQSGEKRSAASTLLRMAGLLRQQNGSWRLQTLTDLSKLPDYEKGWGYGGGANGAPVDAGGNPVLYDEPKSWKDSASDGERWRWLLAEVERWNQDFKYDVLRRRADFATQQFGEQTLGNIWYGMRNADQDDTKANILALDTLADDETIARLATGIKRFKLPADQHPIALHKQLLALGEEEKKQVIVVLNARRLGELYLNRRQFPRAAEYYRQAIKWSKDDRQRKRLVAKLSQITDAWGTFEAASTQPAGTGATVDFRFRNATQVELTAQPIDVEQLLADVKAHLESNPKRIDRSKIRLENLGYSIFDKNRQKYIGKETARWQLDLDPAKDHFDRRTTLTTPLQTPGAYFVTAKVSAQGADADDQENGEKQTGNTCHIVLWVADTAIVRKPASGKMLFYVADAATGKPIAGAKLDQFGYEVERIEDKPNNYRIHTSNFASKTSEQGIAMISVAKNQLAPDYQWMTTATTENGRLAFLGFKSVWLARRGNQQSELHSAYVMTDRPVYRPNQTVQFKAWVQRHDYGASDETSQFAHQAFRVELYNARGDKVLNKTLTANAYGGLAGEYALESGAPLGLYRLVVDGQGQGTFRVEEYKKPEFEVTVDAPDEAIRLGGEFEATVSAKYYFGAPVTAGTLKYKVTRTRHDTRWYPPSPWDWLYGEGYWWFAQDAPWYPGWSRWGCWAPTPPWFHGGWEQPELIAEGEAALDENGQHKIPIDTALAKQLHGDSDHSYQISAEVVDASRRTITGSGEVLVTRKPYEVFVWLDRGHYRQDDTVTAHIAARRPDGEPVAGMGKLRLLKVTYPANKPGEPQKDPQETEVKQWELATGADGRAELQIKASEPGQYRIAYELPDAPAKESNIVVEGGQLFTVAGEKFDGGDFEFNDLELIPDQRNYQPGEEIALRINTNRVGSTVLLFVRPESGVYPQPRLVKLNGKSTLVKIKVDKPDAPNFFIEAITISAARVHTVVKQIAVPPQKRMLNVEVAPSTEAYQPGQEARVKIRLTDLAGEPFVGETVITVYDKSVEYIAGGSNVGDIREHFWSWRRQHYPGGDTNLDLSGRNLTPRNHPTMEHLGIYGYHILPSREQRKGLRTRTAVTARGAERFAAPGGIALDAAEPSAGAFESVDMAMEFADDDRGLGGPELKKPTVRTNFADTAYWTAALETDEQGFAEVKFPMPENLTAWKIQVWGMGHGARVGEGTADVVTRKDLLVRLQTPRFLVERDEVVLSANVHNYLDTDKEVRVRLEVDGDTLSPPTELEKSIKVPAGSDRRVDWRLTALREGEATVRALALTDEESDAMQLKLPVTVHGIEKMDAFSGVIARDGRIGAFEFTVPEQRRPEQTRLEVRYSPTLAGAMVDALPYLIDYPHGCTEQTLNRFLPAVLTQRTLREMGVDLEALANERAALNPGQLAGKDKTEGETDDPKPAANPAWQRMQDNPVFDQAKLDDIVATGVRRLTDMQLSDGGWGWFSGYGERSTAHTTAVVVRGLLVAQENDVKIAPDVLSNGVAWLKRWQAVEIAKLKNVDDAGRRINEDQLSKRRADNLDALVHLVLTDAKKSNSQMRDFLYRDRTQLAPYSLAMLGVALHNEGGQVAKRDMVVRNLRQFLVTDKENQTAYLNLPGGYWWYWYGSEMEAHAYFLKLMVLTAPEADETSGLVKYLLANRRHATYWNSTRDTALVVEAMADYLKATGEGRPELKVEVWLDGQRQKEVAITGENLLKFDNTFVVAGVDLQPGQHTLELRKSGGGRLYWNGFLTNFTLEDDIRAAGLEVRVDRKLYKLTPVTKKQAVAGQRGQALQQETSDFERTEVTNLASVTSGELVEVELTLHSKNDYEYLMITDHKPAGMEPVDLRSGYTGNELGAYVEYRDQVVNLFLRRLARGSRSVSYRLRAETPGKFSALPTEVAAMYAPELKGNSDEIKVQVLDRPAPPDAVPSD